jgi:glycosyltransferase involved in cell wall biosynthesis
MPAVSVITPAYNVAAYLGDAVRSALAQTFVDLELLIVDDGSTDGTAATAFQYAATDSRVRVLQKVNGGISSARNFALRQARGRFIAILDSDDVWLPEYLASQVEILEARPEVAIVTGNGWFLGGAADGELARPWPDARPHPDLASLLDDETAVFILSVFRRDVYEAIGEFDESLRTNEDYDYWLRAACAGFRFYRNDRPLGRYRRREDSLSSDEVRMLRGIVRVLEKTRPALQRRPGELAILERKASEYERRRLKAEARLAIESGDFDTAAACLGALRGREGGRGMQLAALLARWAPTVLARAYQLRRGLQRVAL